MAFAAATAGIVGAEAQGAKTSSAMTEQSRSRRVRFESELAEDLKKIRLQVKRAGPK